MFHRKNFAGELDVIHGTNRHLVFRRAALASALPRRARLCSGPFRQQWPGL